MNTQYLNKNHQTGNTAEINSPSLLSHYFNYFKHFWAGKKHLFFSYIFTF